MEASTFKEALGKQNYAKDECFINSIYDFYHDSVLKTDKKRSVITRASILKTIGKTGKRQGWIVYSRRPTIFQTTPFTS